MSAPRSIDEYLKQLRAALAGEDAALIQDALYDAEEYLRSELVAHPGKAEGDVLELIASTYGAPEEVAAAYRETEQKVKAHLAPPSRVQGAPTGFFQVYLDPRAYLSLFYMLLALFTGTFYFVMVVAGLSLSAGLSVIVLGIPVFLLFIALTRALSLGEGRLLEAITGERMPRRPVHPGAPRTLAQQIGEMLRDARTWSTLMYLVLMLPLGILYFVIAVVGLSVGLTLASTPFILLVSALGWIDGGTDYGLAFGSWAPSGMEAAVTAAVLLAVSVLILTALMHAARGITAGHARLAKVLLVVPG